MPKRSPARRRDRVVRDALRGENEPKEHPCRSQKAGDPRSVSVFFQPVDVAERSRSTSTQRHRKRRPRQVQLVSRSRTEWARTNSRTNCGSSVGWCARGTVPRDRSGRRIAAAGFSVLLGFVLRLFEAPKPKPVGELPARFPGRSASSAAFDNETDAADRQRDPRDGCRFDHSPPPNTRRRWPSHRDLWPPLAENATRFAAVFPPEGSVAEACRAWYRRHRSSGRSRISRPPPSGPRPDSWRRHGHRRRQDAGERSSS